MPKITAIIIAKNEEKKIDKCLENLKWCNQRIVIDDFSQDDTVKIARSRGAEVFERALDQDFSSQRNFGLEKAKNDWVLFVDADEIVTPSLSKDIVRRVKKTGYTGFYIPRKEFFGGKTLNCADKPSWDWSPGPIKLLRLGKKNSGKWEGKVHEVWKIKGEVGELTKPLHHLSFETITDALKKIDFYSSIKAKQDYETGLRSSTKEIIFYPAAKLIKNFFWHLGFLDGTAGLIFCLLMSLQSFLSKAKLRLLQKESLREDK